MSGRLVWAPPSMHETVWKNPPAVLMCALQPRQIDTWRKKNKWADALNMIIFTDDTPPKEVRVIYQCVEFAPMTGEAPHVVVNAPTQALQGLLRLKATEGPFGAASSYVAALRIVARSLLKTRVAWIQPESDHSIGALTVAAEVGMCVAYSHKQMIDSIGARAAGSFGVDVKTLGQIKGGFDFNG